MAETKRGPGRPAGSKNKKKTNQTQYKPKKGDTKAKAKAEEIQGKLKADRRVIDEIWAIIVIALGAFVGVSIYTQGAGKLGVIIGNAIQGLFGFMAFVIPFYLILFGILLFAKQTSHFNVRTFILLFISILMLCMMYSIHFTAGMEDYQWKWETMKEFYATGQTKESGGFFGMVEAIAMVQLVGEAGTWIAGIVIMLICLLLILNTPLSRLIQKVADKMQLKRLIKENAHLDYENEDENEINSLTPVTQTKPQREIKIIGAADQGERQVANPTNLQLPSGNGYKKKSNVMDYSSDEIFGVKPGSGTKGLEGKRTAMAGFGLDGGIGKEAEPIKLKTHAEQAEIRTYQKTEEHNSAVAEVQTADQGTPDKANAEKISNKEAKAAMLTSEEIKDTQVKQYKFPPFSLLEKATNHGKVETDVLKSNAEKLEETLKSFNVDASVSQVIQGPTVTRYEIQPAVGVKVSKIVSLEDDIALNLKAKSLRIEAPIPGKAAVGIEIENESPTMVRFREVVDSEEFKKAKSKISMALGKDINGGVIVGNLKDMPHMLIAGTTGSGKSVCINSIITSIMYKAKPDEVKLILIDPKVVELGNYNGIPHLLIPVVTDPTKSAAALNWAVAEMTDRYNLFAEQGVRDLESYNEYVEANGTPELMKPQIVIIIDELADLMMVAPQQIQDSICRLAQMARAAGMHLIVATQRPSVDVITGVIKNNIPSRIAFAVSSYHDSMTILDMKGAESLVGKGDMLYAPLGKKPIRVQGAFISDEEVNSVIDFVKKQVSDEGPKYQEEILTKIERVTAAPEQSEETDDLLNDCIELVVHNQQASVSMLQRRFRIGYNRAARIIDMIEERGIIGPQDGARGRQVLITEEQYYASKEEE